MTSRGSKPRRYLESMPDDVRLYAARLASIVEPRGQT